MAKKREDLVAMLLEWRHEEAEKMSISLYGDELPVVSEE